MMPACLRPGAVLHFSWHLRSKICGCTAARSRPGRLLVNGDPGYQSFSEVLAVRAKYNRQDYTRETWPYEDWDDGEYGRDVPIPAPHA